jgi:hypothetical protein
MNWLVIDPVRPGCEIRPLDEGLARHQRLHCDFLHQIVRSAEGLRVSAIAHFLIFGKNWIS